MVEAADTRDLKSLDSCCTGSSPVTGTSYIIVANIDSGGVYYFWRFKFRDREGVIRIKVKFFSVLFVALILTSCAGTNSGLQAGSIALDDVEVIDMQQVLNEAADDTQFEVFLNSNIVLADGESDANVLIQNTESNGADCKVYLYLDGTGECIYESDVIPAGFKIENAPLSRELDSGVHPATGSIHILNSDGTDKSVVTVATTITVLR